MKKAIIIGATSGIGQEVAKCLLLDGWQIGVAGRRQSALENLQRAAPDQIQIQALDVTQEDAGEKLNMLIDKVMPPMDFLAELKDSIAVLYA